MLAKDIDQITVADLEALVENRIPEGRTLEYKRDHYGRKDEDRREFAADVSALANASGGDLLIGISEVEGVASEVVGVEHDNPDRLILAVTESIRTSLEPQIVGVRVRWIEIGKERGVLVIRVPRSWSAPHRVIVAKDSRFYVRDGNGKHPMSVEELRISFSLLADLEKRVRNFREERLQMLRRDEGPRALPPSEPRIAFHIIPQLALGESCVLAFDAHDPGVPPLGATQGHNTLFSIDGFVTYSRGDYEKSISPSFTTLFRNGTVEAIGQVHVYEQNQHHLVALTEVEKELIDFVGNCLPYLSRKGVAPPFYLALTLLGVRGKGASHGRHLGLIHPFRSDEARLPILLVSAEDIEKEAAGLLKPLFDFLWNAFGRRGSPNYDEKADYIWR